MNELPYFILVGALLLFISLRKAYQATLADELRHSENKDRFSLALYKTAQFGAELNLLLWLVISLLAATLTIMLIENLDRRLAFAGVVILILIAFAWLPARGPSSLGKRLATLLAPLMVKLLQWLHPLLGPVSTRLRRWLPARSHTGLYGKTDLLKLLATQAKQSDNHISQQNLHLIEAGLKFEDQKVRGTMQSWRLTKKIEVGEPVGPHLMDELHKDGATSFPVVANTTPKAEILGVLYTSDLMESVGGGKVKDLMRPNVGYINEGQSLAEAAGVFLAIGSHTLIVIDKLGEASGILRLEQVIEKLLGRLRPAELEIYKNPKTVADILDTRNQHAEEEVIE